MSKSIKIALEHHKILKEEFPEVSRQTVYASLKYFNNSDLAKKIRAKALELLEKELTENKPNHEETN